MRNVYSLFNVFHKMDTPKKFPPRLQTKGNVFPFSYVSSWSDTSSFFHPRITMKGTYSANYNAFACFDTSISFPYGKKKKKIPSPNQERISLGLPRLPAFSLRVPTTLTTSFCKKIRPPGMGSQISKEY